MRHTFGTQAGGNDQKDENYIDAAANTREVTSFLVKAKVQMQQLTRERLPRFQFGHTKKKKRKKIEKEGKSKKSEKRKIQKKEKRKKIQKNRKRKKSKKQKKEK